MIQRVCELFMNNILYFCEQLEISIWQHCPDITVAVKKVAQKPAVLAS